MVTPPGGPCCRRGRDDPHEHGQDVPLPPTPSQTIGPFYGYALPFPAGGELAPAHHPEAVTLHGRVIDGAGEPVQDALLETWQAGPAGELTGATGSMRRDAATGAPLGRETTRFTGFGRVATDSEGRWSLRTLRPGATGRRDAPHLSVCVFARGLLHHLYTRVYLPDPPGPASPSGHGPLDLDPLLAGLPPVRRATLLATAETPDTYRFDIRLQGAEETVFLDFPD